ncbi:MAG TPA: ATP synthase F1 subunit epsilon [Candidatus Azoamicus sp. OHIO2]
MDKCFELNIVTTETLIYSGLAKRLIATGILGELEILYNHTPFLTSLAIGPIWFEDQNGKLNSFIMLGGILEVQPKISTILGDSVIRADNLDEAAAIEARNNSERIFSRKEANIDYAKVKNELAIAIAQLRLIRKIKDKR